jgi:hypothetical protein
MRGIKVEINKSAFTKDRQLKMFFGVLRGGIYNAIYGFRGVCGKKNETMLLKAKSQGNIKIWFQEKMNRDEAFLFLETTLRLPNPLVKRISRIRKRQGVHLNEKRINRKYH